MSAGGDGVECGDVCIQPRSMRPAGPRRMLVVAGWACSRPAAGPSIWGVRSS